MALPIRPLGDYWQLLQKNGLLADQSPLPVALLAKPVELVSCDSQEAAPGTLFIVKGAHFKGEYLADALAKGAFVYLSDRLWPEGADHPCILVTDVRRAMALLADLYYDHPSGKLRVVGITGTKGKSTTAYYLKYIFDAYEKSRGGRESGILGSIRTYDGKTWAKARLTTPEPLDLERHLANAADAGLDHLALEVSSQALKYDRVEGVDLSAAVFLNIGEDHISPIEHPDLEDYFASKLKIFRHSDLAVVNLDCDRAREVLNASADAARRITFSLRDPAATVYGSHVRKEGDRLAFRVRTPRFHRDLRLSMPGLFNVENALAAIAVCEGLEIPEAYIAQGLAEARVPGRMEIYQNAGGQVTAIVDFAHNALSFERLFQSVQAEYPDRKLTIVFGCVGQKAYDRRRGMSETAAKYAHRIILTEDDPGGEDPLDICRELGAYIEAMGREYSIETDRTQAIRMAVMEAEGPTVVLVAGKGADDFQKRVHSEPMTPDGENVQKFLREYDQLHGLDGAAQAEALLAALPKLHAQAARPLAVLAPLTEDLLRDAAALRMAGLSVVLLHPGAQADGEEGAALLRELGVQAVACTFAPPGSPQDPAFLPALLAAGSLPVVAAAPATVWDAVAALKGAKAAILADGEQALPSALTQTQAEELLKGGALQARQVQILQNCLQALNHGAAEAVVLNAQTPHALLLDAATGRGQGMRVLKVEG